MTSPDGRFTAQVEIEIDSRIPSNPDAWPPCLHTTRVNLTGPDQTEPLVVHLRLPRDEASGNTAWIVDWSADSRYLLFGDAEWQYETDYSGNLYWLHDTQQNLRRAVNYEAALLGLYPDECTLFADVIGFGEDNRLVIAARPDDTPDYERMLEEEAPEPSCLARVTNMLFDPATSRFEPLPDTTVVERYGAWQ